MLKSLLKILNTSVKRSFSKRTKPSKVDKVTCPWCKEPIGSIVQENGRLFYWSTKDCGNRSLKRRCISKSESRKRVYLSDLKAMKVEERRDKLKRRSGTHLCSCSYSWSKGQLV